jgi:hypothetical protein
VAYLKDRAQLRCRVICGKRREKAGWHKGLGSEGVCGTLVARVVPRRLAVLRGDTGEINMKRLVMSEKAVSELMGNSEATTNGRMPLIDSDYRLAVEVDQQSRDCFVEIPPNDIHTTAAGQLVHIHRWFSDFSRIH